MRRKRPPRPASHRTYCGGMMRHEKVPTRRPRATPCRMRRAPVRTTAADTPNGRHVHTRRHAAGNDFPAERPSTARLKRVQATEMLQNGLLGTTQPCDRRKYSCTTHGWRTCVLFPATVKRVRHAMRMKPSIHRASPTCPCRAAHPTRHTTRPWLRGLAQPRYARQRACRMQNQALPRLPHDDAPAPHGRVRRHGARGAPGEGIHVSAPCRNRVSGVGCVPPRRQVWQRRARQHFHPRRNISA
jgi:uncharacterized protein (DUF3084 family)